MGAWVMRIAALVCLLGVGQMGWDAWVQRRQVRECFATQRKLQVMIDNLGSANVDATMDEIYGRLVAAGTLVGQMGRSSTGAPVVLSLELEDPGGGKGSCGNYVLMAGSRMVGCAAHGSVFIGEK